MFRSRIPRRTGACKLAQNAAVNVIGDVELFCRERRASAPGAPFVAITGTNGKSTTTALVAHLVGSAGMDAQMGGNIGTAILSLAPPRAGRVHIIECSSYQIDLAPTLNPSVGILINLSEDHLDRHGTMQHYTAVKERLIAGVPNDGTAIVGVDDEWCRAVAERREQAGKPVTRVSVRQVLSDGISVENSAHHTDCRRQGFAACRDRRHRLATRFAQCAKRCLCRGGSAGARINADGDPVRASLVSGPCASDGTGGSARAGACSSTISKATNADSAAQALACFDDIFWIAGGKPKTGGIELLRTFFPRIRKAYLIGEAATDFAATLGTAVPHEIDGTLDRALASAARDAESSSASEPVVLLSPACASFDQYRNFEIRGDAFRALVRALPGIK